MAYHIPRSLTGLLFPLIFLYCLPGDALQKGFLLVRYGVLGAVIIEASCFGNDIL